MISLIAEITVNRITIYILLACSLLISQTAAQNSASNANSFIILESDKPLSTWLQLETQTADPLQTEQTAHQVLNQLQDMPVQSIFVPLLKHWQNHQAVATTINDHGHTVAQYNISARASGELNRLLSEQTERFIYHLAATNPQQLLNEISALQHHDLVAINGGLKRAIQHLDTNQKKLLAEQLINTRNSSAFSTFMAIALDDPELQLFVINHGHSKNLPPLVRWWQRNPEKYSTEIIQASRQPGPHQKQAITLMTQINLSKTDIDWLFNQLHDNNLGRTAARVLGRQSSPTINDRLWQNWQQTVDPQGQKNLLYALTRSPQGLNKLKTVLMEKSSTLSNQQQRWLRQQMENSHE